MTTSIGPLANPDYYLRMQRSHQAANGYYTGGGEPDGIWWNPAGLLGLKHGATVGTDAFYRLCEGFSPDGEKLTQNAGSEKRSAGLDLTFSADKSVSAVWAVAGERLRTAIADAHTAAVQYTLEQVIEAHCATTRIRTRGLSGARGELAIVPADLIAALFQHGTSRADDPQLHTHCTVMNAARAHFDGKYRALNQYPLYRWKMAAGATYRNHLAFGLRGLGFKVEQHGKDGAFTRIAGVPRALEAHWSKRTAQIEAFARANGFDVTANPQLHTAANHLTRAPKRDTGDDEAKRARWRAEAQAFSFGEAFIAELRHEPDGDITPERLRELTARLEQLPERLTREESVFSYPALAAAVRNATAGLLHPDAAGTALERVLRSESLVRLSPLAKDPLIAKDRPGEAPHLEVEAGMAHTRLYTTRATLEMERAVQDMAERLAQAPGAAMALARVDEAIKDLQQQGYPLSGEQASAIRHATTGAGRIALIEGAAGSGKTTTLRPIVDLYRERGYRVLGAAIAWRTALALGSDCAMEALAVRKLLAQAARGQLALDGAPTLLVIDEAGLLSTREMHHILALGERHGLTLLFAGDTGQQQPIEAGPGLRLVRERIGSVRVDAMHRQKADVEDIITPRYAQAPEQVRRIAARMTRAECERVLAEHERTPPAARTVIPWQISASEAFRDGRAGSALFAYHARGRVHLCSDDEAALARLVSDWARYEREEPGKRTAVLARTNAERRALSARMREVHLPPSDKRTTLTVPVHHPDRGKAPVPLDIAVGERLRIGATHWERRLFNGTIVTVEALEQRKDRVLITGRTDTGREVRFHHDEIRDYHGRIRLEHGYALTIASAQGLTAERVFLYADARPARQTIYPAATRHRERLDFYLDRRPLVLDIIARAPEDAAALDIADDVILAYLGERWSRGAPKAAALDYPALPPQIRPPRLEGGEAAVRPRPAVALDRSITRAARAFRAATREFRDGNTALAVPDAREVWRVAQASHEAQAQRVAEAQREARTRPEAEVQRAAQVQREAQTQREAETRRKAEVEHETQARHDLNAALGPYTEALCRRFLPEGVKQDGRWRVRISYFELHFSMDIPLSGSAQGTWRLEASAGGQGNLFGLFGKKAVLPISGQLPGAAQIMWKDRLAGKPGDLLDIVHLMGRHATAAEAREAGYAFCERQAERETQAQRVSGQERRDFNAAAEPWAEALCRHYFPLGVKQDDHWHVRIIHGQNYYSINVPLSGAAQGRWKLEATSKTGTLMRSLISKKAGPVRPIQLFGHGQEMWKDRLAGKPGDLLDIVHIKEHCSTTAQAMEAGRAFIKDQVKEQAEAERVAQARRESQAQREAQAPCVTFKERRDFFAAAEPWAEALCRRYLPRGVKQDGQWRTRINIDHENEYPMSLSLSGVAQGLWRLEGASGQDKLFGVARSRIEAKRTLLERDEHFPDMLARSRPHYVDSRGPGQEMWRDKLAGKPGNLLDIIQAVECASKGRYVTEAEALAAGRAFIETQAEARHDLNAELARHAEVLCRRYFPKGVKRDGHWRVKRTVLDASDCSVSIQLSGAERGAWKNETTGEQSNQLFDLVYRTGKHATITETMDAGRALIESEAEAERVADMQREAQAQREEAHRQRKAQREARRIAKAHRAAQAQLRKEWKAHHALAPPAGDTRFDSLDYRALIRRTRDLAQEHANLQVPSPPTFHADLKQRIAEDQAHETACRPLRRHVDAVHAHTGKREQLQRQERFHSPPVFNDQYPKWRREANKLIAAGQKLLKTPDPAQLAETTWLSKVQKATTTLEKTVHDDSHYFKGRIKSANADLVRHAEAVCRRYLPQGVKQDGQWRARVDQGGHTDLVSVQLSGSARGAWKNETTGEQSNQLLDLVYHTGKHKTVRETLDAAHALDRELSHKIQHKISRGYSMGL